MSLEWLVIGILLSVGVWYLVEAKRQAFKKVDWVLLAATVVLALFTIAFVGTMLSEPFPSAPRAAGIGALIFGGITVLVAVVLGRRLAAAK
jgi:hypothetical protein